MLLISFHKSCPSVQSFQHWLRQSPQPCLMSLPPLLSFSHISCLSVPHTFHVPFSFRILYLVFPWLGMFFSFIKMKLILTLYLKCLYAQKVFPGPSDLLNVLITTLYFSFSAFYKVYLCNFC